MSVSRKKLERQLEESIEFNVTQGLEFIRKYHPALWDKMDKEDIGKILAIGNLIYKVNPEILEATTRGLTYVQ